MGSGISLNELTVEEVGEKVTSLGKSYIPYKDKIIEERLSGDLLIDFLQSEEQIQELFDALTITNAIHKKIIRKDLIDPYLKASNSTEQQRVSTPRLKITQAKEQDNLISQSIDNNKSAVMIQDDDQQQLLHQLRKVSRSNKVFFKYNNDFTETLPVPYQPKQLTIVKKFPKLTTTIADKESRVIITTSRVDALVCNIVGGDIYSWSFFPCHKPSSIMISNDKLLEQQLRDVEEAKVIFSQDRLTHSTDSYPDIISKDPKVQTIKAFTLEDQKLLIKSWIESSSKHVYVPVRESCGKCKRCRFNTNPSIYNYRINTKTDPHKVFFYHSYTEKDTIPVEFIIEVTYSLSAIAMFYIINFGII